MSIKTWQEHRAEMRLEDHRERLQVIAYWGSVPIPSKITSE